MTSSSTKPEWRPISRPSLTCWPLNVGTRVRKLQARFFAGDYGAALDASHRAQSLLFECPGMLERPEHEFFSALTHAALCDAPAT